MLIFCRGFGICEMKGSFTKEKIDKIISKYFTKHFNNKILTEIKEIESKNIIQRKSLPLDFIDLKEESIVQEPTYKEIYIIYRNLGRSNCNEIEIVSFENIPMADLELIFPEVYPSLRPSDILQIFISMLSSIGFLIFRHFVNVGFWSQFVGLTTFGYGIFSIYGSLKNIKEALLYW